MKDYDFGNFLSELRVRSGLSQYQLGALVGVSNKAVSKWENGRSKPNSKVLPKLGSVLGISVDELLACRRRTSGEKRALSAMNDALWQRADRAMKGLYGEVVPVPVRNRYESEKAELEKSDVPVLFFLLSEIRKRAEALGEHVLVRGCTGAFFVAYLLGATESNPLAPHYLCPVCKKAEFILHAADGWDLPPAACACGQERKRTGHKIPFELYKPLLLKQHRLDLSVSAELYPKMGGIITECSTEFFSAVCEKPGASGMQRFILLPKGTPASAMRSAAASSYPVIAVMPYQALGQCRSLEQATNTSIHRIDWLNGKVLEQFQRQHTDGIPEFSGEYVKRIIKEMKPQSCSQLMKISGLAHSPGAWENNAEELLRREEASGDEIIAYRDDVWNAVQPQVLKTEDTETGIARMVTEQLRKGGLAGQGAADEMEKVFAAIGLPEWYFPAIRKIRYLFPKAHGIAYIQLAMAMMWYRINYPELYGQVLHMRKSEDVEMSQEKSLN